MNAITEAKSLFSLGNLGGGDYGLGAC
jgi:hypothetical protein